MGIYSRLIFPRLCDWTMRSPSITRLRSEALSEVDGEILEIGFGTGLNLEHYPVHVRHLTAVDPGVGMTRIARRRIEGSHIDVDLRVQTAEELPFEDERFDCVVSTWTLCSIRDGRRAVAEIGRVLKPGGRFLFLEHGLSEEPRIQLRTDNASLICFRQRIAQFSSSQTAGASLRLVAEVTPVGDVEAVVGCVSSAGRNCERVPVAKRETSQNAGKTGVALADCLPRSSLASHAPDGQGGLEPPPTGVESGGSG